MENSTPTQWTTKALVTAYTAGRIAQNTGWTILACPYEDVRAGRFGNIVTGARAYRKKWQEGWKDSEAGLPARYGVRRIVHKCFCCGAGYPTKRECFSHLDACEESKRRLEAQRAA